MTIDYQLHLPDYLAKCINLDKPQLHCDGQCALMQKIKESEKKQAQKNLQIYQFNAFYLHNDFSVFDLDNAEERLSVDHFSREHSSYVFTYNTFLFRPPISSENLLRKQA
ncbi:hypothetical protein [Sphingobacterium deserti]|nr:hypothetical protein [Sphingobacterium deserti]